MLDQEVGDSVGPRRGRGRRATVGCGSVKAAAGAFSAGGAELVPLAVGGSMAVRRRPGRRGSGLASRGSSNTAGTGGATSRRVRARRGGSALTIGAGVASSTFFTRGRLRGGVLSAGSTAGTGSAATGATIGASSTFWTRRRPRTGSSGADAVTPLESACAALASLSSVGVAPSSRRRRRTLQRGSASAASGGSGKAMGGATSGSPPSCSCSTRSRSRRRSQARRRRRLEPASPGASAPA